MSNGLSEGMSMTGRVDRRHFLMGVLSAGGIAAVGKWPWQALGSGRGTDGPDGLMGNGLSPVQYLPADVSRFFKEAGKRYSGTNLNVLTISSPQAAAIQGVIAGFEELTGIRANFTSLSENGTLERTAVSLSSHSAGYDVYQIESFFAAQYAENDWFLPVQSLQARKGLSYPRFDLHAYTPSAVGQLMVRGKLLALPMFLGRQVFYYRTDVFKEHNIAQPRTLGELAAVCARIHNKPVPAIAMRSGVGPTENVFCWSAWLYEMGGKYFEQYDPSLGRYSSPALDSPAAIRAAEMYAEVLRKYGVPGGLNWQVADVARAFESGSVAMVQEGNTFAGAFNDKATSTVAGKVGAFTIPKGPAGAYYPNGSQGWGVNRYGDHIDAAWLFSQWATHPATLAYAALQTSFPGAPLTSLVGTAGFKKEFPLPGYVSSLERTYAGKSSPVGGTYLPALLNWTTVGTNVSIQLNKIITGESSATAGIKAANGALAASKSL